MKKLLLLLYLSAASLAVSAQVEKGDKATTFAVSYLENDNYRFGLTTLKFGSFVSNSLELGIKSQFTMGGGGELKTSGIGLGFYGSYNFLTDNATLLPYLSAEINALYDYSIVGSDYDNETHAYNVGAGVTAGSKYFLNEKIYLDMSLNYSFNLYNGFQISDGDIIEDPDYPGTITLNFGIGFLMNKKTK